MSDWCIKQKLQEGASVVVHAVPTHTKSLFPRLTIIFNDASSTTNAGVVEKKIDMGSPSSNCITEGQHLRFNRNVGNECQDFARVAVGRAYGNRFSKIVFHDIARRDVATIGGELTNKFATHSGAAARYDSYSSSKSFFKTFSHGFPQCVAGGNHNPSTQ